MCECRIKRDKMVNDVVKFASKDKLTRLLESLIEKNDIKTVINTAFKPSLFSTLSAFNA